MFRLAGMGLEVERGDFSLRGRGLLSVLSAIPATARNRMIFDGLPTDLFMQRAIQKWLGGSRPVRFRFTEGVLKGLRFECETSHKYFLLGTAYEKNLQAEVAALIRPNDLVYDIGAHFGWWTLWFSAMSKFVVAFEPSPSNFQVLRRNIERNRTNVELKQVAASNCQGSMAFLEDGTCSHVSSSRPLNGVQVKTEQIDAFAEDRPPSLAKIDVEGHAANVLEGMEKTLKNAKPTLILEIHDHNEESGVLGILARHAYKIPEHDRGPYPKHVLAFLRSN